MQGLYLSDVYDASKQEPKTGVGKKIQSQVAAFRLAGFTCEHVCLRKRPATFWDKLRKRLAVFGDGLDWQINDTIQKADFLYIRRPSVISLGFLRFLKEIKTRNSKCKLIMEIPTYPYDEELKTKWFDFPLLWQDRICRKQLHKYLDRIAILTTDDEVFGIPTLKMQNGVDLCAYRIKKQNREKTLNIGCVAEYSLWHGIDRMLAGLAEYKLTSGNKRKIHLYLAGEGPQSPRLKKQVKDLGLTDDVTFCGMLDREELYQQIYDQCDIGIEGLGTFRCNAHGAVSSSLKSKEYLAVGLPMIYVEKLDVLESEPTDFCLQVPSNEKPLDLTYVIAFYDGLVQKESKEQLSKRIRSYAERHVGWDKTFFNVITWIKQ